MLIVPYKLQLRTSSISIYGDVCMSFDFVVFLHDHHMHTFNLMLSPRAEKLDEIRPFRCKKNQPIIKGGTLPLF